MIKSALTVAVFAASTLFAIPAEASRFDRCYDTKDGDQVCMMHIDEGEYTVAIKDLNYVWPTTMHLTCFDDGTNDYESYGSIPNNTLDQYADGVCSTI